MKKLLCLSLALVLAAACMVGCVSEQPQGSSPNATTTAPVGTTTQSTPPSTTLPVEPTDPSTVATEPTEPPTEATEPPTEPTEPPTEPTEPPTEPTEPPTEPTEPPTEPTEPPTPAVGSSPEYPAELAMGENLVSLGEDESYWFQWIAEEDTTLRLEFGECSQGWSYRISNETAGSDFVQSGTSTDELLANPAQVSVLKGDVISIEVSTRKGKAGEIVIAASLADPMGTEENPIRVHVSQTTSVRIPAGKAVYVSERAQGTTLVIKNADDAVVIFQGEEYRPVNGVIEVPMPQLEAGKADMLSICIQNNSSETQVYDVKFQVPVGTLENPDELEMGENVAVLEKDDPDGYIFTWVAPEDGVLTLTMPSDADWCYSLYNMTSYASSAQFYSDDDPVVSSFSMEVKKGDVLQISVSTYNPKRPAKIPAGEVHFTAEFQQN